MKQIGHMLTTEAGSWVPEVTILFFLLWHMCTFSIIRRWGKSIIFLSRNTEKETLIRRDIAISITTN